MPFIRSTLPAPHWVDVLRGHAQQRPESLSFAHLSNGTDINQEMTFGQLDRRARAIASRLQDQGLAGQRVLLLFPNDLNYIAAFMGCLYAGATAVPVYPPQMGRQVDRMLAIKADCGAKAMLTSRMIISLIDARMPELIGQERDRWIATDEIPDRDADQWLAFSPQEDDLAFLQYTSGSTGQPKGVRITHGNLLHNQTVIQSIFRTGSDMVGVGWLPLYHDMGLIGNVLYSLFLGTPLYLMSPLTFLQNPFHWLQAISTFKANVSGGPNFAYELCLNKVTDEDLETLNLSNWQIAFTGAEPVRPQTLQRFADKMHSTGFRYDRFLPCYGLAESTLAVTGIKSNPYAEPALCHISKQALRAGEVEIQPQSSEDTQTLVSCGGVGDDLTLQIVHPERGELLPEQQIGEVWVQGKSIGQGYWNQPERNGEIFQAKIDGQEGCFLRTGDLGFLHEGQLYLTGRLKDLIIIRGKNHYPQDIEHSMTSAHPALRAGGGVATSVERGEEEGLLVLQELQTRQVSPQDADEIITAIREAIAKHHELQVSEIVLLPRKSILKTSSGKLRRQASKVAYQQGELRTLAQWIAPSSPPPNAVSADSPSPQAPRPQNAEDLQQWIVGWMATKLNMSPEEIDASDPVTVYGVDSMLVQEFESDISQYLGFSWPVSDLLLTEPSIEEIAQQGAASLEES